MSDDVATKALALTRSVLQAFHAERHDGRTVQVARLGMGDLIGHLNVLAALEREAAGERGGRHRGTYRDGAERTHDPRNPSPESPEGPAAGSGDVR